MRDPPAPSRARKKRRPEASFFWERLILDAVFYCRSCRTDLGFRLACASIAVLACIRIWFFVYDTICAAMSVSRICDSAACMFSAATATPLAAISKRFW